MKKPFWPSLVAFALVAPALLIAPRTTAQPAADGKAVPLPRYTPTPDERETPTATPEPTASPTPKPTATPTVAPTPIATPVATPRGETRRALLQSETTVRVEADLLEETTRDFLTANFSVAADGKTAGALTSSSGSRRVDDIVRSQIARWKFAPALQNGAAVASAVKLRVEFR